MADQSVPADPGPAVRDGREYKVTLRVDQDLTFSVEGATDAADAYRIAFSRWQDGEVADDHGWPTAELDQVRVGEHEVRFNSMIDYNGPRDERGLHRWKFWATDDKTGKQLAEGHDVAEVARRAVEAFAEVTE